MMLYHYERCLENTIEKNKPIIQINIGHVFFEKQLYDDAISCCRKALENNYCPPESRFLAFESMAIVFGSCKNDPVMRKFYYDQLIQHCFNIVWIEEDDFFDRFCDTYKYCHPKEAEKMKGIITDINSFKYQLKDAYENWSDLTKVHQMHVQ